MRSKRKCIKSFKKCRKSATKRILLGKKKTRRNSKCVKKFISCNKKNRKSRS